MKKYILIIALCLLPLSLCLAVPAMPSDYTLLEPGILPPGSAGATDNLATFLTFLFKTLLTFSMLVAVISIILAGIAYITSNTPLKKVGSKEWISGAIGGLILALVAWAILNTINPKILQWNLLSLSDIVNTLS